MSIRAQLKRFYWHIARASVRAAMREQGLSEITAKLATVLPSIADQYTLSLDGHSPEYKKFWDMQVRVLHAFQIRSALDALGTLGKKEICIADIGDSSGNHGIYLEALAPPRMISRIISVNLDPIAIKKIRAKGREAILCRAEELNLAKIRPDIFFSFEMIEHLIDPIGFLRGLAQKGTADYLLLSVPYVAKSRFGGIELRKKLPSTKIYAEQLHLFELSPPDWSRLFRFAGFGIQSLQIYRQYPRYGLLRVMQPFWKMFDFEGFVMFLLKRDHEFSSLYQSWPDQATKSATDASDQPTSLATVE